MSDTATLTACLQTIQNLVLAFRRLHQKQALTFMLRRERGWAFFDSEPDVWEIVDEDRGRFFLNRVSNASQTEEPPQCYGGIVADPMGLGKTLTMIALVATDLEESSTQMLTGEDDYLDVPTTLIIVPPPLIGTWEEQLADHVVMGSLTCRRHHREGRLTFSKELATSNIVLTTYHTVSAEWSPSGKAKSSILYSVRWRRIILDEAHLIRNGNSKMSHAICALESRSRWAVTGTPIQNRLGDLATLFKFIRAHPYTDRRCFDTDISRLWKAGEYQEAIKRLKRLSKCLLLRRDKGTVSLPPRQDLQCPVDFDPEERAYYNRLREQAITSIDEVLKNDSGSSRSGAYVNVLQQIESLRLVSQTGGWAELAQDAFNVRREMEPIICLQCSSTLDITETFFDELQSADQNPLFFSCLGPSCAKSHVSTGGQGLEASWSGMQSPSTKRLPSKVEALIADIKALPPSEKCIVFSTWRLTLDVVEAGLNQSGISSVRFDGKVPQKNRQDIVDRFRHDSSIRIMLLTLSCGAAGLTLTVATRAYLMEPHWNPTVEEQALARIHRIGQSQEVTTVRFFVRDSFEQQVIKVQESKRYLAGLLLSPHDTGQANENLGRLQELLSLI
ncbi:alpha-1,6-mannosyltransferase subunit [Fusarium heterosporum]|uniref:Alpha-1,6-mannosyltransferase subunit n=1 Tax=Fusarium heterosporum TaxID=42747 RepID=A0A8H5TWU7_FUSHE|nr:alpha-1,6-mannosyltransferase subunit [Fusarium heterosporum]